MYYVDIYNKEEVKLDFSPDIFDYGLYVKDGRCKNTQGTCACDLKDGSKLGFVGWRCVDFTNKTKPRKDKVYVFRFLEARSYYCFIVIYKKTKARSRTIKEVYDIVG